MSVVHDTNLEMVRGDTLAFAIEIEGLDQNLDSAFFSCKKKCQRRRVCVSKIFRQWNHKNYDW